ncbi:MAG TPA: serine/threonine-protein kinase, partial [Myxococcota bacterium]|nr:serine/threonine-protein kinase [Myxococcota bacterium]
SHSLVGEALIGRGAQGTVFRSRERLVQRDVAIKVLDLRTASTIAIRRFVGEARALERIDHPGVPTVYGLSQTGDRLVLKMRLILAPSLVTLGGGSAALGCALLALERAARVVAVAHRRGIIHRDLKPEHILAGPEQVQVIDWGLARNLRDEEEGESGESGSGEHTRLGAILGTPGYMSPEQADGQAARASPQSDIYSLGRILLFLLLGRHPRPEELPGVGPPELCSIARRALRLHPEQYGSADEFAEDLRRFRERQPVLAHHYPLRRRVQFGLDRLKRPALAGLALAAVLGGIWELRGWQGRMDAQRAEEEEDQQWSDKIRDAWSNNVQPENVVAVVMAGAFRPNLAEARSMFLAWEAAQPPHYLERVRLRDFETCGGRKLLLSRGGAACFGSLAGGEKMWKGVFDD